MQTVATTVESAGSSPRLRGTRCGPPFGRAGRGIIPALAGSTPWSAEIRQRSRDHPRACGEHFFDGAIVKGGAGSSPRLRGTQGGPALSDARARIIPALAGNTHRQVRCSHGMGDHPRACGEHHTLPLKYGPFVGSSPRLRGTPTARQHSDCTDGIIPALAGNTTTVCPTCWPARDHPRACGEHFKFDVDADMRWGSSPRLRGTLPHGLAYLANLGIIPALAGNTWPRPANLLTCGDHPRACGEHMHHVSGLELPEGSSPRLRGTLGRGDRQGHQGGIIPALAGNTPAMGVLLSVRGIIPALAGNTIRPCVGVRRGRDHPRACGEHHFAANSIGWMPGSSPRLRGTRDQRVLVNGRVGIIPALAGNTCVVAACRPIRRDHPRACGEHFHTLLATLRTPGSSPRLRGTRQVRRGFADHRGIIPALAGNTQREVVPRTLHRDHPRACGEHVFLNLSTLSDMGSSPRLRGTLLACLRAGFLRGIIPALAGNTSFPIRAPR